MPGGLGRADHNREISCLIPRSSLLPQGKETVEARLSSYCSATRIARENPARQAEDPVFSGNAYRQVASKIARFGAGKPSTVTPGSSGSRKSGSE
jgi:hypothetical protein